MIKYIAICFFLSIVSCGPDDPVGTCSLDSYNGKSYKGFIYLCNALPGLQQDFEGKALMTIGDSTLIFLVESIDPNHNFSYSDTLKDECREAEPGIFIHLLHDFQSDSITGYIGGSGTSLSLDLMVNPCLDNGSFSGLIKE